MYGECGETSKGSDRYNCKYDGQPKVLPYTSDTRIKEACPHLFKNSPSDNQTYTCCDPDQLEKLNEGFLIPRQLTAHCPACFFNLRAFFCDLVCSPDQSDYLIVTEQRPYIPKPPTTLPPFPDFDSNETLNTTTSISTTSQSTSLVSSSQPSQADVVRLSYHMTVDSVYKIHASCK
jgi:hypothetical protein